MIHQEIITKNSEETRNLAQQIASNLKPGTIICLYGNLGSGKTTFTQGFSSYFKIKQIRSPTFVIVRRYKIPDHQQFDYLYHLDLYRLNGIQDIKEIGIDEINSDQKNILVVEWAEKMKDTLPKKRIDICFEYLNNTSRKITIFNSL